MNLAKRIGARLAKHSKIFKLVSGKLREPKHPNPLDTYRKRFTNTMVHGNVTHGQHYDDLDTYLTDNEIYAILWREYKRLQPETRHTSSPPEVQPAMGRLPIEPPPEFWVDRTICPHCFKSYAIKIAKEKIPRRETILDKANNLTKLPSEK